VPAEFAIVGQARTEMTNDEFRAKMKEAGLRNSRKPNK